MKFWYGIIRNKFGKIRSKRTLDTGSVTQSDFLALMEYDPKAGDVIVELDFGKHMEHSEFMSYVSLYFQSNIHIKRMDIDENWCY